MRPGLIPAVLAAAFVVIPPAHADEPLVCLENGATTIGPILGIGPVVIDPPDPCLL